MISYKEKYPTLMSESHCATLEKLIHATKPDSVLEVGCYVGGSTCVFLDILNEPAKLYVTDAFLQDSNTIAEFMSNALDNTLHHSVIEFAKAGNAQFETWKYVVGKHPKYKTVFTKVYPMLTSEYITNDISDKFDLVFLDARHTYEEVSKQLEYFDNCPVICGDDYSEYWTGVKNAVDEYVNETGKHFYLEDEFFIISDKEITL